MKKVEEYCNQLYELIEKINGRYLQISYIMYDNNFFMPESKSMLVRTNHELTFEKIVFFIYKVIFERSGNNIKMLNKISHLYAGELEYNDNFEEIIHAIRTVIGHYISDSSHDKAILKKYKRWFLSKINKEEAEIEEEWAYCVILLLEDAILYFERLFSILNSLVNSGEDDIFEDWYTKQSHSVPKHIMLEIIVKVKKVYQFSFDEERFLQKSKTSIDQLIVLLDVTDKEKLYDDLYKQIEKVILSSDMLPCPLSGKEVIEKYNFDSTKLAHIMKTMQKYYDTDHRMKKEQLIDWLDEHI
jgi:hypothetical protein